MSCPAWWRCLILFAWHALQQVKLDELLRLLQCTVSPYVLQALCAYRELGLLLLANTLSKPSQHAGDGPDSLQANSADLTRGDAQEAGLSGRSASLIVSVSART